MEEQFKETPTDAMDTPKYAVWAVNNSIKSMKENPRFAKSVGLISDGYHTFDELYEFRKMYNAVLFNEWGDGYGQVTAPQIKYNVHKSWKHEDGTFCFGEPIPRQWFIVSAMLPTGLISNHYRKEDWDLFKVPEVEKALYKYDGHTGADVLARLKALC